jgi:4-amino-4-deoxy-L-arabinose transferase-like glycosyltransferase
MTNNMPLRRGAPDVAQKTLRILLCVAGVALLFSLYTWGISYNPPGFYLDESATAYNAYLVSRTGAGEFGPRFPILFQEYAVSNPNYINPLTIYLLAIVFRFVHPSILLARSFAAFWMFAACLLLDVLAKRISGQRRIGVIVAGTALLTPWLFEVGRLVWDAHFSAFTIVVFLLAAYHIQSKDKWNWQDIAMIAGSLAVVAYGYFSGRVLAPLFALGLLFFATTKPRFLGVLKIWLAYAATLVPLILFNRSHSGVLTRRLWEVTYIRPGATWKEIPFQVAEFVRCYLQDQSLTPLLLTGDPHWHHHVEGSGGAILFATFILAMAGLLLVITRRCRDPWWRFVLYGLAASIVPGAITDWPFHQLRLMGYAVFLLVLTVPALEWLFAAAQPRSDAQSATEESHCRELDRAAVVRPDLSRRVRLGFLGILLVATVAQAVDFQITFWREGPKREFAFDVPYKPAYDAAVAQPQRPIYLENGQWGPAYMDAYWYATVESRPLSEFVRLAETEKPPSGAIVLSSNSDCHNCEVIQKSGAYLLYKAR